VTPRTTITLIALATLAIAAVVLRLLIGLPDDLPDEIRAQALSLRWMRVGAGASVGVCLAVAGVLMQSLMRNPLASPDLMGMSSGAGLAVMLARAGAASLPATAGQWIGGGAWETIPALVGALGTLTLVWTLSQRRGLVDPVSLVLIGVVVGILCGAGIGLVQHLSPTTPGGVSVRMLIGTLSDETTKPELLAAGIFALLGVAVGMKAGPAMDAGALEPDEAASVGVRVGRLRVVLLLTSGILTAVAVVLAGPLGFVGLICPHIVRLLAPGAGGTGWWGVHRLRVVGAAFAGIALVVGGDCLVSAIKLTDSSIGRVPLGIVMAFIGAPVFVLLLRGGIAKRE